MPIEVREIDERQYLIDRIEELELKNMTLEKHTYAAPHVWNLVSKVLREEYSNHYYEGPSRIDHVAEQSARKAITDLALVFAKRFEEDEGFDPISWLDKCSPDPDLYPFSELWADDGQDS